jgi:hypothetical protein
MDCDGVSGLLAQATADRGVDGKFVGPSPSAMNELVNQQLTDEISDIDADQPRWSP